MSGQAAADEVAGVDGAANALPAVAVVSVTYNRIEPLLVLLRQLRALDYPRDRFEIFLTDNASGDDTAARVAAEFPEVRLKLMAENLGTSAGFNKGIRAALEAERDFDFIWLLDSDAEVEAGTLRPMVEAMSAEPRLGIVGSCVYDPQEPARLVAAGLDVDWARGTVSLVSAPDGPALRDVDLIPACSLMIRSELCRRIGLWDERYWVYWGDTDWCVRAKRNGFRICALGASRVWHRDWANTKRGFAAPAVLYDDLRGGLLFNVRHHPDGALSGARHLLLKSYLKGACEYFTMRPYFDRAYVAAVRDFLAGDFATRDYNQHAVQPELLDHDGLSATLATLLPPRARILVNRRSDEPVYDRFRATLGQRLPDAVWDVVPVPARGQRQDFTTDYGHYVLRDLRRFLAALVSRKHDAIISEVGIPSLYSVVSARYTVLLAPEGRGLVQRNDLAASVARFCSFLLAGLYAAYVDLPRALRRNARLRAAIDGFRLAPRAS